MRTAILLAAALLGCGGGSRAEVDELHRQVDKLRAEVQAERAKNARLSLPCGSASAPPPAPP